MKTVVVLQSNYIPWKGYFDLINDADLFLFYDDVQYTKNDWRNRNKIKTSNGAEWITIPVGSDAHRLICEVEIKDSTWQRKHWRAIKQNYSKCSHFSRYQTFFEYVYMEKQWSGLSELNQYLIRSISRDHLNLTTEFGDSREYDLSGQKLERLLKLLKSAGADRYISGPGAKDYIDASQFAAAGIDLHWKTYSDYPIYSQRFPPFEHSVSIIDLLFNVGPDAPFYISGWREGGPSQV